MPLLNTLKTTHQTTVRVGEVQIQPVRGAQAFEAKKESRRSTSVSARGTVSPSDAAIPNVSGVTKTSDSVDGMVNPSISTLVNSILTNKNFIIPGASSQFNKILPSYPHPQLRHKLSSDTAHPARSLEPYERLAGISHERPEIVMLTHFLPMFHEDLVHSHPAFVELFEDNGIYPFMTDAGLFIDTQFQMRVLHHTNVIHSLRSVQQKNFAFRQEYKHRKEKMTQHMNALREVANFLLGLVRRADNIKGQLDLRDDTFQVDVQQAVQHHLSNFTQARATVATNYLLSLANRYIPPKYDIPTALIRLGYSTEPAKHLFSSTKLWLQLLYEYKKILQFHSLEFLDIEPSVQRRDQNASSITRNDVPLFKVTSTDPVDLTSVSSLINLQVDGLRTTTTAVNRAFSTIYERGAHFKTEEARIAALANVLAQEYRYSRGVGDANVARTLSQRYGYTVATGNNLPLFDNVIGNFGNNVADVQPTENNSLVGQAQRRPATNVAVLTFESKYLEGDDGTMTPGSAYFIDPIFRLSGGKFDTSKIDELARRLKDAHHDFSVITNGLNLLGVHDADQLHRTQKSGDTIFSNPIELIQFLVTHFVDKNGQTLPALRNDRLTSIYALAARSVSVRTILFLYTLSKLSRAYASTPSLVASSPIADNTPLTNALIDRLLLAVVFSTRQTNAGSRVFPGSSLFTDSNDIDGETIKTALKQGTRLTKLVETLMGQLMVTFRTHVFVDGRSRYGGRLDTVLLMVAFDLIVSMLAKYGNQQLTARLQGGKLASTRGKITYVVEHLKTNHKNSVHDLVTRVERETTLVQKLTYCVLNTLQKLANSLDGFSGYLKSPQALSTLKVVTDLVPDQDLLQVLLSEQQIMLFATTVFDLLAKLNGVQHTNTFNADIDHDGDFDADDEIRIVEDLHLHSHLRNVLYGMLGTDAFATRRANNKRILTIGIPAGFTHRLKQRVRIDKQKKTSFVDKQSDIVSVVIYKIDLLHQDIIYRPKKFAFEMSRFPVRIPTKIKQLSDNSTLDEIISAIPTRDFEESFEEGKETLCSYWSPISTDESAASTAMSSESYSFLRVEQKAEIMQNHVMSYLLDVYIRLLTGVSVSDHHFEMTELTKVVEPEFTKLLLEHKMHEVTNFLSLSKQPQRRITGSTGVARSHRPNLPPVGGVMFATTNRQRLPHVSSNFRHETQREPKTAGSSGLAGKIDELEQHKTIKNPPHKQSPKKQSSTPPLKTVLASMSYRQIPRAVQALKVISHFTQTLTSLSDGVAVSKHLIQPRKFDRVFNVVVDPDEFEIDYKRTVETEHGKLALDQLLKRGDVGPANIVALGRRSIPFLRHGLSGAGTGDRTDPNIHNFKFRDRDRNEGDMAFEKYFVTIETFGEEGI